MNVEGQERQRESLLFCVVRFDPADRRHVSEVLITFGSVQSAEKAAKAAGWDVYQVAPMRFHAEPVSPPKGPHLYLDDALGRRQPTRGAR